jgi:hypothetical protein
VSKTLSVGEIWAREHGRPFPEADATNRSMCRIFASAHEEGAQIVLDVTPEMFEAIFLELEADAPCGICHRNPCAWQADPKAARA